MPDCEFDELYAAHANALKRLIMYKVADRDDADDVMQDILAAAYAGFARLGDPEKSFKPWLMGIAAHKLADYYRAKARRLEIPVDKIGERARDRYGNGVSLTVRETLSALPHKDKQILYLFYIQGYSQKDISDMLSIPEGTVKSRVFTAKQRFKKSYPFPPKGESKMKSDRFPQFKPQLSIDKSDKPPFSLRLEEIPGWFIVPRLGERAAMSFYDDPDGRLTGVNEMVCGRSAVIHGVPCAEVEVTECYDGRIDKRTLYMKITDTHVTYVAEATVRDNVYSFSSFVDDEWLERYAVGENNQGRPVNIAPSGIAAWAGGNALTVKVEESPDIIGRFLVKVGDNSFDCVALAELCDGIFTVQYITPDMRTILFRRYNRYDWKQERYGMKWTDKLPDSERLTINGDIYVHWYDCLGNLSM